MIKRILVALDLDSDTPIATRYALEVAKRTGAMVTGLAVVDMGSIESSSRGGGIGSMYFAEKLRENMTSEARAKALELTEEFRRMVEKTSISHVEAVEEGVPFQRIVEDMKFSDLLIVGSDPHFFYSHPTKQTHTLARIIQKTIGPTLVVPDSYHDVKKVLFAIDGSNEAARAVRHFLHLEPFGGGLEMMVVNVSEGDSGDAELLLKLTTSYIESHGCSVTSRLIIDGSPRERILDEADAFGADLIVIGAHTRSTLLSEKLGDTTGHILREATVPVFVDH